MLTHSADLMDAICAQTTAALPPTGARNALTGNLKLQPFRTWQWRDEWTCQFDRSKGATGFPEHPGDVLNPAPRP